MFFVIENSKNLDIQFFKQKERRFKKDKFKKLLTFFHVYINLHFVNIIREYKIIINLNVFIKELKYKYDIFFNIYTFILIVNFYTKYSKK